MWLRGREHVCHKALGLIYSNMRKKFSNLQPGPEAHTPVILLLEVGRQPQVQDQSQLYEFETSLGYRDPVLNSK